MVGGVNLRLIHTIFARGRKSHLPREGDVVLTGCSEWEEKLEKTGGCAACCQLPAASLGMFACRAGGWCYIHGQGVL